MKFRIGLILFNYGIDLLINFSVFVVGRRLVFVLLLNLSLELIFVLVFFIVVISCGWGKRGVLGFKGVCMVLVVLLRVSL